MKSKEAIARDEWFMVARNRGDTLAHTLGKDDPDLFLGNRLERAFLEGVEAGKKIALDRINAKLKSIIDDNEI